MYKDFHKDAVLTSQNPEAFINFRYEPGDASNYYIIPRCASSDSNIQAEYLYINGLDINGGNDPSSWIYDVSLGYALKISSTADPSIASFHLYTRKLEDFSYNIKFDIWDDASLIGVSAPIDTVDVSVFNRQFITNQGEVNAFETSKVQVDGETSYLVLRTNPKFTGNIKLNIDSSNYFYLDTFKISDILNNKKYRRQRVSAESTLSGDIRRVYNDLPRGEMYKLDAEDTLNISIPKTELYKQFNLNYSYGARLFEDELYPEEYSLLAPLWINSQLPDYFVILRIDGNYNPETYPIDDDTLVNISDLANKYLEEGELIKSWGMKEATPLGTYMRNHLEELLYVRSPLFLSLSDPTQKDPDPNTWYGIAVDKGIITGRSETPYFFDQKETFTEVNAFVSEGFERQNLLCPNLLNLEFAFNDNDVSTYSMHRYFGLYLTENELYEISYYAHDPDSSVSILSLDTKDSSVFFNSSIFDSSGNISDDYKNRIFTLNDIQIIKRITNVEQINGSNKEFVDQWLNKPGDNIFSTEVFGKTYNKFITISLDKKLSQGEHLRFVDRTNFKIWEIYGINTDILNAGEYWTYASESIDPSGNYPSLYRVAFSVKGDDSDQINAIKGAFDVFQDYVNTPFETTIIKENKAQLSFKIKDWAMSNDIWFQRLTAQTVSDPIDPSSAFNSAAGYGDIKFYGYFKPTIDDFERLSYDASYGPIDFELYGDRMSLTINLLEQNSNYYYSLDASTKDSFKSYTMYMGTDEWYRLINSFDINTAISRELQYVIDPHELDENMMVSTTNKIYTVKNIWNAYTTYPLIISLMGINPVKDMDFTVYDTSLGYESEYWYARDDDVSSYYLRIDEDSSGYIYVRNSFEITSGDGDIIIGDVSTSFSASSSNTFSFNTFDSSAHIISSDSTPVLITYSQIDGSYNYTSYNSGISEENINDFYVDSSTKAKLKYGLTVPYVAKWVGLGNDCRNNPFRLILDASIFDDASTNFIPYDNNFKGEISFPSFKYLDRGTRAWEDYIYFDINDVITYTEDSSTIYKTFKELMFEQPYIDVFSKLVYSNHNINATKLRSSLVYYNDYKETVDTLLNGLSLSFKLQESAKSVLDIQDWDRFRISFISTSSKNRDNNNTLEIIVNENTETILMIWYQGSDMLHFNKRYSTYFSGKGLLDSSSGNPIEFTSFRTGDRYWSFIKTPFVVNTSTLSSDFVNIFGEDSTYDSSLCSPYAQLNWSFGDFIYSVFNAYDGNVATSNSFEFFNRQYNTFRQYVDYNYIKEVTSYGDNIVNYGYNYMNNYNFYKDNTCSLDNLKFLINNNYNIGYYIFRDNVVYSNSSFPVPPLEIAINNPREYKDLYTYNGWYRPKFNNILDFNYNEDLNLIQTLEKDFTFANTNFKEYNNIPQYWYNKVVSTVTTADVSTKNAIGYIENYNVFKSQWDNDYYTLSGDSGDTLLPGYNSTLELPSYFGSKLIKLPDSLNLSEWDSTTSSSQDGQNWHTLNYNLTRRIVNKFKENADFVDNWSALTTSDTVIDGYIKNTVIGYYNISKPKIRVEIWTKPYDGDRYSYTLDTSTFKLDTAANVDGKLNFINNEYIYSFKVPVLPDLTYYVKFALFEK